MSKYVGITQMIHILRCSLSAKWKTRGLRRSACDLVNIHAPKLTNRESVTAYTDPVPKATHPLPVPAVTVTTIRRVN